MLIEFEKKLIINKTDLKSNLSDCYHCIDLNNGSVALYDKELDFLGTLNLSDYGITNSRSGRYYIDTKYQKLCVLTDNSIYLYDFDGNIVFNTEQEILAFSIFEGRYLWIVTNQSDSQVICTLHDLHTKQQLSLALSDPMVDRVPQGEHPVESLAVSDDCLLISFSDAQTSVETVIVKKKGTSLCLVGTLDNETFPVCCLDDCSKLLTISFDPFDGFFRFYDLSSMKILGEIPFAEEEADYGMMGFDFHNGTAIVKEYNEKQYYCLDSNTMRMDLLEIGFVGQVFPTKAKIELQSNNNVVFALVETASSRKLFASIRC